MRLDEYGPKPIFEFLPKRNLGILPTYFFFKSIRTITGYQEWAQTDVRNLKFRPQTDHDRHGKETTHEHVRIATQSLYFHPFPTLPLQHTKRTCGIVGGPPKARHLERPKLHFFPTGSTSRNSPCVTKAKYTMALHLFTRSTGTVSFTTIESGPAPRKLTIVEMIYERTGSR